MSVSLLTALADGVFGVEFMADSWRPWRVALKALFAEPLDPEELRLFAECTGREAPQSEPAREGWIIAGRRGGKTRAGALIATYLAAFRDYRGVLAPGERGVVMLLAADRSQARVAFRYIQALFDRPLLRPLVERETLESLDLTCGVSIEVHTSSFRTIRGRTVVAAILDEIAFWRSEDASDPDHEVVNALRPSMATVPGALLLAISTGYARKGAIWRAHGEHFGRIGDPVLVWKAPTRIMNPLVPEHVVESALAEDPAAAGAEYALPGREFRADLETFIDREVVDAAVVPGRRELEPMPGRSYFAFADPSGGRADSFTLAIAHAEHRAGRQVLALDALREWRPPFSPDIVVRECAKLLRTYHLRQVSGDRFSAEWVVDRFRAHSIKYVASEKPKSAIYLEAVAPLNAGRIELLDHPRLVSQLCALERRTTRLGRDTVDHPPSGHDDLANAAMGALVLAGGPAAERAIARRDWVLAAIEAKRGRRLYSIVCGLSGPGPDPASEYLLDSMALRRRFELGLIDRDTYEERRKRELPLPENPYELLNAL